jgi:hypothetical protein
MKKSVIVVAHLLSAVLILAHCGRSGHPLYSGKPFSDSVYHTGAQIIPGNVQCEYFDSGGEGIAYHDSDSINSGSGRLNPSDGSYLHEFRKNEAVDISYTKIDEREIDNNPFNRTEPQKDQHYVGWTEPGEWLCYTVRVLKSGTYSIGLMVTSAYGGQVSLTVDAKADTIPIRVNSTADEAEPVQWRQWHHWNYLNDIAEIRLTKGIHVLKLTTVEQGNMNYDYLSFKLKE